MADARHTLRRSNGDVVVLGQGLTEIGREAVRGVKLLSDGTSRHHAKLTLEGGKAVLEDAGSTNGTFVNGQRLQATAELASGDLLRFDREEFEYRVESAAATVAGRAKEAKAAPFPAWVDPKPDSGHTEKMSKDEVNIAVEDSKNRKEWQEKQRGRVFKEPCLTVVSGGQERIVPLTDDGTASQEWTIGRNPDCALRFDESGISEWHAKIVRDGKKWKLIDAIATNGLYVNGMRVGMSYLEGGDFLRFGRVQCVFNLPGGASPVAMRTSKTRWIVAASIVSFAITALVLYLLLRRGIL